MLIPRIIVDPKSKELEPSVLKIVAAARARSAKTTSCSVLILRKIRRLGSGAATAKQITGMAVRNPN
jgi:hypothetical protein